MNDRRVARYTTMFLLAAAIGGCQSSCSLFTTIEPDDAGHWSFVRQVVPKLLGRKIKGHDEAKLLVDVINATPNERGREEVINALMQSPEFGSHWSETLVDLLRVNREGIKNNSACYGPAQRTSIDPAIASFITSERADLSGFTGTAPSGFNMTDVVSAAVAADNLYATYAAHLFALHSRPVTGNMVTEANKRDDLGGNFNSIFLHRKIECMQCHNSSFSRSGPQTYWQRTWAIWGKPEAAVYENEQGGNPANFNALFRTDVTSGALRAPWGGPATTRGLQSCGTFNTSAPTSDNLGASPYMTQLLPVGSSIWDVQRLLHQGRRTLANDGLVRSQPPECSVCSTAQCQTGTFPPLPEPATSNVHTLFSTRGCHTCHRAPSPAASMDLQSPNWTNNVIDIDVDFLAPGSGVKRVARGDAVSSYLVTKLRAKLQATDPGHRDLHPDDTGLPMPRGGLPALSETEIQQVEAWINSLPTATTTPMACAVCASTTCTAIGSELNGPAALAFLVGLNVSDQIWQELLGSRVTIANYFARTQDQMNVLWSLSEFTLIPNDWSLREVTKRILLSDYFNRKSPRTTSSSTSTPYVEPIVLDPWIEADPRVPPISVPGWTPSSTTAPTPDPLYQPGDHPDKHKNSMSEGVHRYSVRSLTYSMHAALGWPAPRRFPGTSYPSKELVKSVGQFSQDSEPGFRDADFQGLLHWESVHKSCARPSGIAADWMDKLIDKITEFNTSNPSSQLTLRDVAIVMKDWFIADSSVSNAVLSLDDNLSEKQVLDSFFGGDIATLTADATNRTALDAKLREYCGVLVQTPQFWLAGIAPTDPGDTPRIRVCNDGTACTYQEMCTELNGRMSAAGSGYRLQCGANSVSVVPRTAPGSILDLCRRGKCGFLALPDDRFRCVIKSERNPHACFPIDPPRCDPGCARIDCCGGPLPPIKPDGVPRPAMLLGWFEGSKIGAAKNVRVLTAADRRRGGEAEWRDAAPGMELKRGDLLQIPAGAVLEVETRRGAFTTPKGGMPTNPVKGPWYLVVTGPSALRSEAHPPMPLRWQQRPIEEKRIETYNQQQRELLLRSPERPQHDAELRRKLRVDTPDETKRRDKPVPSQAPAKK